jgi:hypothetical protein
MSWVYNRGLVFGYEDARRQWPLRVGVRTDKAHMYGTVNIHRRHQTKGFLLSAADGLVIGGCFWRVEPRGV